MKKFKKKTSKVLTIMLTLILFVSNFMVGGVSVYAATIKLPSITVGIEYMSAISGDFVQEGSIPPGMRIEDSNLCGEATTVGTYTFTVSTLASGGDLTTYEINVVPAADRTAPALTPGAVNRTSDTEGTVKFTSSEAGSYYYAVVADGAEAPTVDTSGAGTACTTAETIITNPTSLTAGAKDIYIKVKDAADNVSEALKIDIPIFQSSNNDTQVWHFLGDSGFSEYLPYDLDMFIDHGTPYVAYYESNTGGKVTVKKYNGSSWETVGNSAFSAGSARYISLFVENGIPYVAYQDAASNSKATVMKLNGSTWENVGNAGLSDSGTLYTSLYIDDGTPYLAYTDAKGGNFKATVMKFNDTGWEAIGNSCFSAGEAKEVTLVVDNGTPYVALKDAANSNKATVMKYSNSAWELVGQAGFSVGAASSLSLQIESGTPYLGYSDGGNNNKMTVMKYNGSTWENVGLPGISTGSIEELSLAVENGAVYAGFTDIANNNKGTVMKYDGNTWTSLGSSGFTAGTAYYTSLKISDGVPYLAFMDGAHSNKATVMYYGDLPDQTLPALTAGVATRTSDTEGTVKFTSNEAGSYYYAVVADDATVPTIDTSGDGTACTTLETTITNPTGLTAGAKDIYIVVKDAASNVSSPIKIDMPAYVASDETITAPSLDKLVTAPVKNNVPNTQEINQTQYTGTIEWYQADGVTLVTGNFSPATVYIAKVTLTAKVGYTLAGLAANSFTYTGATNVTNPAGSGVVTITFPSTAADGGGGGGGTPVTPPPTPATGDLVDENGNPIKGIPAEVTKATNGTTTIAMKSEEAILFKQPDGTDSGFDDLTKIGFSEPSVTGTGSKTPMISLNKDGTIEIGNLNNGTETRFDVTVALEDGQQLVIGHINVTISSSGVVTFSIELVDPYGIITDSATGKVVSGADAILYYANTERNKAAGKTPDTVVNLPELVGFEPNDNKNPQVSDSSGAYGWMVFPTTDYYIVATKDGYEKYVSPTISVEQEIVKWDFKMDPQGQPSLLYQAHVQNFGWMDRVTDGELAGTTGLALRNEAFKISLVNASEGAHIKYQTHVQDFGWMDWVSDGEQAGTTGEQKRQEAIKISLENMPGYSIQYQVHVQDFGWTDWVSDGELAGTTGQGKRLEGIKIKIIKN